jgi:hypothetical protein
MAITPQAQPIERPTRIERVAMSWINRMPVGGAKKRTMLDFMSKTLNVDQSSESLPSNESRRSHYPKGRVNEDQDGLDPDSERAFEEVLEILGVEMVEHWRELSL